MLKDVLDQLPKEQHRLLMYAFEHGLSQFVTLSGNKYIGVNTDKIKHLTPTEKVGVWTVGEIKGHV